MSRQASKSNSKDPSRRSLNTFKAYFYLILKIKPILRQYSVGFDLICVSSNNSEFKMTSSGDYRKGYCVLTIDSMPAGTYNIRPSTYLPGQESAFFLEVSSSHDFVFSQLQWIYKLIKNDRHFFLFPSFELVYSRFNHIYKYTELL